MVAACARLNHMIELVGNPDSARCDSPACHAHATFYPFDLNFTLDVRVGSVVITTNSCLFELELARLVCSPCPARRLWSSQRRAESTPWRVGARHDPGVRDGARGERVIARACAGTTARPGLCLFLFITLCL